MDLSGITAEALTESRPELVAEFEKVGFDKGREEGLSLGKIEGAQAESQRVASIDEVAMAGYEDVVSDAKADGKSTAQDVKLAIFDKMQESTASSATSRATDGANLAAQAAELTAPNADENKEVVELKEATLRMAKAGKKARGEK